MLDARFEAEVAIHDGDAEKLAEAEVAIHDGDADKLAELLASGLDPNATSRQRFAQIHRDGIANVSNVGIQVPLLVLVSQFNQPKCARVLLEARADPRSKTSKEPAGQTSEALQACFEVQRQMNQPPAFDIAADLISFGADPNVVGRLADGCTMLMLACEIGDDLTTRFLLDHHADPNLGKTNGSTPLFKAAQHGHVKCLRLLIAARAHLEAEFQSGCTA